MKNLFIISLLFFVDLHLCAQSFEVVHQNNIDKTSIKVIPLQNEVLRDILQNGIELSYKIDGQVNFVKLDNQKPNAFAIKKGKDANSMDFLAKKTYEKIDQLTNQNSDLTLGFYLLESIKSEKHNQSSGLYFELPRFNQKMELEITIGSNSFSQELKPAPKPQSAVLVNQSDQNNRYTLTWNHHEELAWIYQWQKMNGNQWVSAGPHIPFVKNRPLDFEIDITEDEKDQVIRLTGHDIFGRKNILSKEIKLVYKDVKAPFDVGNLDLKMDSITSTSEESFIDLKWTNSDTSTESYKVYVSQFPDSNFVNIEPLQISNNNARISLPQSHRWVYVKLTSTDSAGNESEGKISYLGIADYFGPDTPYDVLARMDSLGVVKITWGHEKGDDFHSYLIESSRNSRGPYQRITQKRIIEKSVFDSLAMNLSNNGFYYRVAAVDQSMNVSDFSELVYVEIQDTIRPQSPYYLSIDSELEGSQLIWKNGYENDVVQLLICSSIDLKNWDTIRINDINVNSHILPNSPSSSVYYKMHSVDNSGNYSSESPLIEQLAIVSHHNLEIQNLSKSVVKDGLNFTWQGMQGSGLIYFVFGSSDQKKYDLIDAVNTPSYFADKRKLKNYNFFKVCVQDESGTLHDSSQIISIN